MATIKIILNFQTYNTDLLATRGIGRARTIYRRISDAHDRSAACIFYFAVDHDLSGRFICASMEKKSL